MALTKVWTPDAVTWPVLAIVDGSVVPMDVCSAAASFCACAVAWDTCMLDRTLLMCLAVWPASTLANCLCRTAVMGGLIMQAMLLPPRRPAEDSCQQ